MLLDLVKNINYGFRNRLFRREVETSFYSNKKFSLPILPAIKGTTDVTDFIANYPFSFFSSASDMEKASDLLLCYENKDKLISCAKSVLDNNIFLYEMEVKLDGKINWSKDPVSGFEWAKELTWKTNCFETPVGTDIKNCWELARFNQGIWLGKAYLITKDERYTEKFLELFYSFINENPFCASINWVNASETSIRLINLCYSLSE